MNTIICSVPAEVPGTKPLRERWEGDGGVRPKIAITSLNHWAVKNGFDACKFYDIDSFTLLMKILKNFLEKTRLML